MILFLLSLILALLANEGKRRKEEGIGIPIYLSAIKLRII